MAKDRNKPNGLESITRLLTKFNIAAISIGILALPFYIKGVQNTKKFYKAPQKEHLIQKGDTVWGYAKAEGINKSSDWNLYQNAFKKLNSNIDDPNMIYPGNIAILLDVDRDNRVGV